MAMGWLSESDFNQYMGGRMKTSRSSSNAVRFCLAFAFTVGWMVADTATVVAQSIRSPEAHFGHVIGADRKLVGWDGIVDYLGLVGRSSDRVVVQEVGKTTLGRPFLLVVVSSPETIANIDRYKALQQRLYFQSHRPGDDPRSVHSEAERREIFEDHKAVVLVTATASGWLRGEAILAGRAAAVQVDFAPRDANGRPGRIVLFGLRPQHRVQTHATFKLLFNALVNAGTDGKERPW